MNRKSLFRHNPRIETIYIQPTLWLHNLGLGVLTVHSNEFYLVWAKAIVHLHNVLFNISRKKSVCHDNGLKFKLIKSPTWKRVDEILIMSQLQFFKTINWPFFSKLFTERGFRKKKDASFRHFLYLSSSFNQSLLWKGPVGFKQSIQLFI